MVAIQQAEKAGKPEAGNLHQVTSSTSQTPPPQGSPAFKTVPQTGSQLFKPCACVGHSRYEPWQTPEDQFAWPSLSSWGSCSRPHGWHQQCLPGLQVNLTLSPGLLWAILSESLYSALSLLPSKHRWYCLSTLQCDLGRVPSPFS